MNPGGDKLNIVFVGRYNPGENLSGPEKTAKRIFTRHSKENKTHFIQYFFDGRVYGIGKKLFGTETKRLNENAEIHTLGILKINRLLKKIKPHVIHIITFERFAVIVLFYRMFNNVKIIYNSHGVIQYEDKELKKLTAWHRMKDKLCEKWLLKYSDKTVFMSENAIDTAEKYYKIDESKSVILSNGIDEVFNSTQHVETNHLLKAVFIYKNELNKSGLDFLKKAFKDFDTPMDVFIITSENIEPYTADKINFHSVKPMETAKLADFYKDKDVFLSLNSYDTFSISTAEAMASGLIPIITKQTGISRYIENGNNGFLADYNDVNGLRNAVMAVIKMTPQQKAAVSANARKIYESLSWKDVYETYYNIYTQITS